MDNFGQNRQNWTKIRQNEQKLTKMGQNKQKWIKWTKLDIIDRNWTH